MSTEVITQTTQPTIDANEPTQLTTDPTERLDCMTSSPRPSSPNAPSGSQPTAHSSKPAASAAKLAANRENAKKSTGPRTPEGKAQSRLNALKHGLLAHEVVLYNDFAEEENEMATLLDDLRRDLKPQGRYEDLLVERIAATHWRLRRLYRFEFDNIFESRDRSKLPLAEAARTLQGHKKPIAPTQIPGGENFDRLMRYEAMIERSLRHLGQELYKLKALRLKEQKQEKDTDPAPRNPRPRQTNPPTPDLPSPRPRVAASPRPSSPPVTPATPATSKSIWNNQIRPLGAIPPRAGVSSSPSPFSILHSKFCIHAASSFSPSPHRPLTPSLFSRTRERPLQ